VQRALLGALLGGVLGISSCAKRPAPELSALELAAAPDNLPLRLAVDFGGAVELLGAKVEPAQGLKPGTRVELTLYWRKTASIARGFRLFTHVLDDAGERILNLDGNGPLRRVSGSAPLFPPSAWDEGKVYVDKQAFTVPSTLRTDGITIVAGLFRETERLPVTRGAHTGDRGVVTKLRVTRPPAMSASVVPTLWIPRRRTEWPLVIDGKLEELSWSRAASINQLVNVATGELQAGADVTGNVRLIYDEQALYVGFEVYDEDVRGGFDPNEQDPHLWLKDTVEIMIDPDGDGDNRDYYEIQVNPQNLVFDSQFDAYNLPRSEPHGPFGHQEWSAQLRSAVVVRGTLDDDKEDEGYVVEMAIPWASFQKAKRSPPKPEDTWRMNFYAMQNNAGAAWSPVLGQGNFHKASRFGRARFAR
jgi:hypothetical protein